jgi:hypothetical protein
MSTESSLIACTDSKPFGDGGKDGLTWADGSNDMPRFQRDTTASAARKAETLRKRNSTEEA